MSAVTPTRLSFNLSNDNWGKVIKEDDEALPFILKAQEGAVASPS